MSDQLDVRRLPYMPLHIERLRKSKAWLRCKRRPEMAFYLMNLWMRAWHELPSGSIEADEDVLADAAMCDPDRWDEIRKEVMQGWELRDGRYYHPTVTELAEEAATKLRGGSDRTAAAREALAAKRSQERDINSESSVTDIVTETVTGDEGKGREEKGKAPAVAREGFVPEERLRALAEGLPVILDPKTEPILDLLGDGITWPDIEAGIRAAIAENFRPRFWKQLVGWVRNAAKDRLAHGPPRRKPVGTAKAASDPAVVTTGLRGLVRRWKENPGSWPPSLGPRPDEPGCRVPQEILAELDVGQEAA